jgi:hypothetical protein
MSKKLSITEFSLRVLDLLICAAALICFCRSVFEIEHQYLGIGCALLTAHHMLMAHLDPPTKQLYHILVALFFGVSSTVFLLQAG